MRNYFYLSLPLKYLETAKSQLIVFKQEKVVPKNYIYSLNGLRAISILLVIVSHVLEQNFSNANSVWKSVFLNGGLGVHVFFVISGFLITTILLDEESKHNTVSLKKFYLRRVFRIFPAYYFLLFIYLLLQLNGTIHLSAFSWFASLTYLKFTNWELDWPTAHFWSLSIEECFYFFWPFTFKFFKGKRSSIAFLIVLIVPVIRVLEAKFNSVGSNELSLFQRGDALMWGCIFAIYREKILCFIKAAINKSKFFIALPFLIILFLKIVEILNGKYDLHLGAFTIPIGGSVGTIAQVCIGLIILVSITYKNAWFTFLNTSLLNFIGKLSYSLYLWQQLFFSKEMGSWSSFPLNLLFIFVAALLSYNLIEKPFLDIKKKFETS